MEECSIPYAIGGRTAHRICAANVSSCAGDALRPAAGALITAGALTCRDFLSEFSPVVHAAVGSALLVPMLIDGGLQYCGNRVSTNWRRALTGSLFGIGVGLIASFLFA